MTESSSEDLGKIVSSLADWARKSLGEVKQTHSGSDCEWCPICQAAAVVRGENPELGEKLKQAGNALLGVVRAFVDAAPAPGTTAPTPSPADEPPAPPPGPRPRVERIELGEQ
jgi:DNA-binding helix-hairpin-helix protein with protein kinase domain